MKGPKRTWGDKDWRKSVNRVALRQEDKAVVQGTRPRIPGAKKDTRRWCQGHVGTPHTWGEWETEYPGMTCLLRWKVRRCTVCGKKEYIG